MKPGPSPTPSRLKFLRGNPGKRPLNTNEPKPRAALPACPKHLSPAARKEWRYITRELVPLGVITKLDRAALAVFCDAYARWVEATDNIKQFGLVLKAPSGFPIISPYLAIANKAAEQIRAFGAEFGLMPASRSRIDAPKPQTDEFDDEFLGPIPVRPKRR